MSFSQNAHEILPRLWLGNKAASEDEEWLRTHNVSVVFNCTKNIPFAPHIPHKYRVPVDDNLQPTEINNLFVWAPETQLKLLREYKAGRTILVHCHAGMQRSAAVVAMFLMVQSGRSAEEAMAFVRGKRAVAFFPAANFGPAIERWDTLMQKYRRTQ